MSTNAHDNALNEQWENGSLGRDLAHARQAPAELSDAVDKALAMKLISMRLPAPMIDALKHIAQYHGIGYQPMVRDLIGRFIESEIKMILSNLKTDAAAVAAEKTAPVDGFMERKVACG